MRVFERMGRIVRADAHGMMDQIEERSLLLKQSLREAEIEVAHKRGRLDTLDEKIRRLKEEGRRLEEHVAALDEDVVLAMGGDDHELARFAVRRLLPKREALRELFAKAAQREVCRARLREQFEVQEAQLAELRPRVRAALTRPDPDPIDLPDTVVVSDEEIDLELLRRREANQTNGTTLGEGK